MRHRCKSRRCFHKVLSCGMRGCSNWEVRHGSHRHQTIRFTLQVLSLICSSCGIRLCNLHIFLLHLLCYLLFVGFLVADVLHQVLHGSLQAQTLLEVVFFLSRRAGFLFLQGGVQQTGQILGVAGWRSIFFGWRLFFFRPASL